MTEDEKINRSIQKIREKLKEVYSTIPEEKLREVNEFKQFLSKQVEKLYAILSDISEENEGKFLIYYDDVRNCGRLVISSRIRGEKARDCIDKFTDFVNTTYRFGNTDICCNGMIKRKLNNRYEIDFDINFTEQYNKLGIYSLSVYGTDSSNPEETSINIVGSIDPRYLLS